MGKISTPVFTSIPDGAQQQRIQAARAHCRPTIGADSAPEDIAAAFKTHNLLEPRDIRAGIQAEVLSLTPDAKLWYVIRTAPKREIDVGSGLSEIRVESYCPKMKFFRAVKRPKPNRPKKEVVEAALFTSYVFAGFPIGQHPHWFDVRAVDGIHSVLGHQGTPQPISHWIVDRLRADEADGKFDSTRELPKYLPGQGVKVKDGPFAGYFANVERLSATDRVKVLLKILGGMVSVDLGTDQVELA